MTMIMMMVCTWQEENAVDLNNFTHELKPCTVSVL